MILLPWLKGCERGLGRGTRGVLPAALAVVLLGHGAPARANLIINPTFDTTITSDPNAAAIENTINQAIQVYETRFADPITININFKEMTTGLGQSNWWFYTISYNQYLAALQGDATTANDTTALAHLPAGPNNPASGSPNMSVKYANLLALGINPGATSDGFAGTVSLNTTITNPGSPGTSGQYSLLVTAEHEIDEVLGLGSGLDGLSNPLPEDLYRYDQNHNRSYTTSTSAQAFFSIDGTTNLAQFDQSGSGDHGDWASNPLPPGTPPRVQDAFATPGATPALGVELTALDAIGYNLVPATAVPEPSPVLMTSLAGLGGLGYWWRRRKAVVA